MALWAGPCRSGRHGSLFVRSSLAEGLENSTPGWCCGPEAASANATSVRWSEQEVESRNPAGVRRSMST